MHSICVFCGSDAGSGEVYADAARAPAYAVAECFLKSGHRDMVLVGNDPEALMARLRPHRLPEVSKWIGRGRT